ncbi:26S proteasome regulatory subunit rpn6 [Entomophthora muscae]|uniref:26S proteasome regulatory subunit rpn6 n=1 Tax=Entomophthora muscae TaxID=34485 RepID=A0ACC2TNE1_9FUNG|nr:26S proteasome regulatory subunit rpn6 [Entomophthora muscae]
MNTDNESLLNEAQSCYESKDYSRSEQLYSSILSNTDSNEEQIKASEIALLKLGSIYQNEKNADKLASLIRSSHTFLAVIPKAKTSKIVRSLIDCFQGLPESLNLQIEVCQELIDWCTSEKRIFLKQNIETKLVSIYLENRDYSNTLKLIATLLKELKRLDDKMVLVEVQLLESRAYHALRNMAKSRAALTSARTSANAIYCPPLLQGALDMQSGILHADDKDFKTAFSYFFETFESYSSQEDSRAVVALKYMLLCKIMIGLTDDVNSIVSGKLGVKYAGSAIDAMKRVAEAHRNRSLQEFEVVLNEHKAELKNDPIICSHLNALYDTLLEQNLIRVIEPFSRVEIAHVAKLVNLPTGDVETKLSQMILDKAFHGILDQGAGCLIVFDEPQTDKIYDSSLDSLKNMGNVVESLYQKAATLG